jgi:hypothetical protein
MEERTENNQPDTLMRGAAGPLPLFGCLCFPLQREHFPGDRHLLELMPVFWPSQAARQLAAIVGKFLVFVYPRHRAPPVAEPPRTSRLENGRSANQQVFDNLRSHGLLRARSMCPPTSPFGLGAVSRGARRWRVIESSSRAHFRTSSIRSTECRFSTRNGTELMTNSSFIFWTKAGTSQCPMIVWRPSRRLSRRLFT